jgi:hypothetical protein
MLTNTAVSGSTGGRGIKVAVTPRFPRRELPEAAGRVGAGEDQVLISDCEVVPAGLEQATGNQGDMDDSQVRIEDNHPVGKVLQALDDGSHVFGGDVGSTARMRATLCLGNT